MSSAVHATKIQIGREEGSPGQELNVYHWNYPEADSTGSIPARSTVIVLFHGFLAHGYYPTVRYAAEKLASAGYMVVAADLPGHGKSPGLKGFLPPPDDLIQTGVHIADYASSLLQCQESEKKIFLMGSSLGGAMAVAVAHHMQQSAESATAPTPSGVALLAPMLRLGIDTPTRYLLIFLAAIAPTLQAIPSSSTSMEKQYRDPQKRKECQEDPLSISGSTIRIGSARTCVELAQRMEEPGMASNFNVPCLVMVALEDVVVNPKGALDFYESCQSSDKTLKKYPALHGLLCEPSPLCDTIESDLLAWIQQRT